ncbi:MAG: hypothetical protein GX456_09400 [Verrucomicrobia bacterium]|nr:hypothetical protein [Verrucomicrobiota bacterium]
MGVGRREAFGVRQLAAALSYAQTTCLEPDRHDLENNVSVPISRGQGFCPSLPSSGLEPGTIGAPCYNGGVKPKQSVCPSICVLLGRAWVGGDSPMPSLG